MPNLAQAIKGEITRLSTKAIRAEVTPLKKDVSALKREVSSLRKTVESLNKRVAKLIFEAEEHREKAIQKTAKDEVERARITAGWISRLRDRFELSRADFAFLVGVSATTVYLWETGKTKPRTTQKASLLAVRQLGKREVWRRLEEDSE